MEQLKVLAMPVDTGGCGSYRVRQPLAMVKAHTPHDAHVVDTKDDDMVAVSQALSQAHVAIVRQGGEEGTRQMRTIPEFKHLKWVLDIDDQIELISPYSQHYSEYGTKPFQDIWVAGKNGFDPVANQARVDSLLKGLQEADLVTVTTPKLAEYASQFNPNVAVLPNCVDTNVWWKLPLKPNKTLRVGWSGGVSHYEDWYPIKDELNYLLRKYRFTLVVVGSWFPGLVDEDLRNLVEVWPWVSFEAHSYRMMCMNLDLAIVPLADLPFNHYKSAVKWYEFAAMELPSVVANITPYREEMEHGKTALAYDTPTEFVPQMETLLQNPILRRDIGKAARAWVVANRDAKTNAHLWTDAYMKLVIDK